MSNSEKILYQNNQWKLLFWGNTHFIEAKHPYPYWRYAKELRFDKNIIEHIGEKNWCDLENLIDVVVNAIKILGITPEYDIVASINRARALSRHELNSLELMAEAYSENWSPPSAIKDALP
jgi:hypothetical protein